MREHFIHKIAKHRLHRIGSRLPQTAQRSTVHCIADIAHLLDVFGFATAFRDARKRIQQRASTNTAWHTFTTAFIHGEFKVELCHINDTVGIIHDNETAGTHNGAELQRVMRDVDNMVLILAMKGMSGEARRHIFNNVSQRLGKMLAEDMVSMGPVRIVDVLEASQTVLNIIIRLIDNGDIAGNYEYLEPFYNVFNVDTASKRQKDAKLSQLREMVEEYEQAAALVREFE